MEWLQVLNCKVNTQGLEKVGSSLSNGAWDKDVVNINEDIGGVLRCAKDEEREVGAGADKTKL